MHFVGSPRCYEYKLYAYRGIHSTGRRVCRGSGDRRVTACHGLNTLLMNQDMIPVPEYRVPGYAYPGMHTRVQLLYPAELPGTRVQLYPGTPGTRGIHMHTSNSMGGRYPGTRVPPGTTCTYNCAQHCMRTTGMRPNAGVR